MADKISPIYVSLFPLLPLAFPEAMSPPFQHREGRGWGLDSELFNIPNPFYFCVLTDKETAKGLAGSGARQLRNVMYRRKDPFQPVALTQADRKGPWGQVFCLSHTLAAGLTSN